MNEPCIVRHDRLPVLLSIALLGHRVEVMFRSVTRIAVVVAISRRERLIWFAEPAMQRADGSWATKPKSSVQVEADSIVRLTVIDRDALPELTG
jgi:hypothetical protein